MRACSILWHTLYSLVFSFVIWISYACACAKYAYFTSVKIRSPVIYMISFHIIIILLVSKVDLQGLIGSLATGYGRGGD